MIAVSRFVARFLRRRGVELDRLRRFRDADLARSTQEMAWTPAELSMMAQAEKLARVSRRLTEGGA